jgi:prepilin-type N-terminal cleavage/methylation domain-containing protein
MRRIRSIILRNGGFSLTELMVVLVIIGVLVLLALPKLLPIVTKAKTTEAKLMLKQVYTFEQAYKFEHDRYTYNKPIIREDGGLLFNPVKCLSFYYTQLQKIEHDNRFNKRPIRIIAQNRLPGTMGRQ